MIKLCFVSTLLSLVSISRVLSQPDLCQNPKLDSIAWIDDQKQYFFTSGSYYWLIKENEMPPPQEKAKKLPNGFTKAESAVYKNSLSACVSSPSENKHQEQEIIISQLMSDGRHMLMVLDLRDKAWKEPIVYNKDRTFSPMQVDWSKSLDAMFSYVTTDIYGVQGKRYAGVNFAKICENPDEFARAYTGQNNTDFATIDQIDAMTMKGNKDLYMFIGNDFFIYKVDSSSGSGIIRGLKGRVNSIKKDFFKFTDKCGSGPLPPPRPEPGPTPEPGPPNPPKPPEPEPPQESQPAQEATEKSKGGSSSMWIIIGVILLIIVVAIIAVMAVLAMRRKRNASEAEPSGLTAGGASSRKSSAISGSKASSRVSVSPSAISRAQGRSPSKMSMRSQLSAAPKTRASSMSKK